MRICVFAECYPAPEADAFARRRMEAAAEIARRGHEVHVLTIGEKTAIHCEDDVWIHEFASRSLNHYSPQAPELDEPLTRSQILYEGWVHSSTDKPFDILDVPLYSLLGLVTLQRYRGPYALSADPVLMRREEGASDNHPLLQKLISRLTHWPAQPAQAVLTYRGEEVSTNADEALRLYEQLIAAAPVSPPVTQRIYQVMEALDYGDAVSNIARHSAALLAEIGQPSTILTRYSHPSLRHETTPVRQVLTDPNCGLIFHYWGLNHSTWILPVVRGPKAIYYHNVTPSHYFQPENELHHSTAQARTQLRQIADSFDLVIADSHFNLADFSQYLTAPKPSLVMYPVVDPVELNAAPYDSDLWAALRQPGQTNILFVGRVARNKRHDRVMQVFDYYYRNINRQAHLWLVGNDQVDAGYRAELEGLREQLPSGNRITFTGKVDEPVLYAYYRAADAFVCASEHEGFCIPLAQAMAFEVPVLAYAAAAVPETLGGAGLLIHEWDSAKVAELMQVVISDEDIRGSLRAGQNANIARFSLAECQLRFRSVIRYLDGA